MSNQALSDERIAEYRQMVAENDTEGYRIEMTIPELIATIDQAKEDERRRIDELIRELCSRSGNGVITVVCSDSGLVGIGTPHPFKGPSAIEDSLASALAAALTEEGDGDDA